MKPAVALVVAALAVAAACVTNPATGKRQLNFLSESQEIALGKESDAQIRQEMGVYGDQDWQAYVTRVGLAMAKQSHRPQLPWTFAVVDSAAINAFALPGGYIYVTRGILPFLRDEAELANVLGHEIAHVTAQHGANAYSQQVLVGGGLQIGAIFANERERLVLEGLGLSFGLLFLKHGRAAELEADRLGVGYAAGSGWDPSGMAGMLGTLGRLSEASGSRRGVPNFLSTHPLPEDRVAQVQSAADAARTAGSTRVNADEFSRRLDGLVWGESREQGLTRGRDFLHPILRFAVQFPDAWPIVNSAESVTAQPENDESVAMLLDIVDPGGRSAAAAGRAQMEAVGFTVRSSETVTINGLQAWVGIFDGGDERARHTVRAAFISHAGRLYRLAGLAPSAQFGRVDPVFRQAIGSFRGLSQAEADRIQPARLDFQTARPGDTWESLARSLSGGAVSPGALAIMNGSSPSTPPRAGARLRVVIGG